MAAATAPMTTMISWFKNAHCTSALKKGKKTKEAYSNRILSQCLNDFVSCPPKSK